MARLLPRLRLWCSGIPPRLGRWCNQLPPRLPHAMSELPPRLWKSLAGFPAALQRRLRPTLSGKISYCVLLATFLTSVVVTLTSGEYLQSYLESRINQKFPAILNDAEGRLEDWYAQRQDDLEAFARREAVLAALTRLVTPSSPAQVQRAKQQLRTYLVLQRAPQYDALFLLSPDGLELAWVGDPIRLSNKYLAELGRVEKSFVGDIRGVGGFPMQPLSMAIRGSQGNKLASLHALLRPASLGPLLGSDQLLASGQIYLIGPDGSYLTHARGQKPGEPYGGVLSTADAPLAVTNYVNDAGERVVGSLKLLPRFNWTIVVEEPYDEAFAPVVAVTGPIFLMNLAAVLVFSLAAFWLSTALARPIKALCEGAGRIADGETDVVIVESPSQDEIGLLTRTFNRMATTLHRNQAQLQESSQKLENANRLLREQNEELHQANEALAELSQTDGLTKLNNHRFFQEHLRREIACAELSGGPLCLALIDIDHFKQLNDRYGHASGDRVLQRVAEIMRGVVRKSDILARYGGEEFAFVPRQATLEVAVRLSEKIRLKVSGAGFEIQDGDRSKRVRVTVSVGVAAFSGDRPGLFDAADRGLYRAKELGRDCVIVDDE